MHIAPFPHLPILNMKYKYSVNDEDNNGFFLTSREANNKKMGVV